MVGICVHVPFCRKRCPYCAFVLAEPPERTNRGFLNRLSPRAKAGGLVGLLLLFESLSGCARANPSSTPDAPAQESDFTIVAKTPRRLYGTAVLPVDGQTLFICGGRSALNEVSSDAWWVKLDTGEVRHCAPMPLGVADHEVARYEEGVVVLGGSYQIQMYDPKLDKWKTSTPWGVDEPPGKGTIAKDGRAVLIGGAINPSAVTRAYNLGTSEWTQTSSLRIPRKGFGAATLKSGEVLIWGGITRDKELIRHVSYDFRVTGRSERLSLQNNQAVEAGSMKTARGDFAWCTLDDGRILVAGGRIGREEFTGSVEIYDPASDLWSELAPLPETRYQSRLVALTGGKALLIGGYSPTAASNPQRWRTLVFNIRENRWEAGPNLAVVNARSALPSAFRLGTSVVAVVGEYVQLRRFE